MWGPCACPGGGSAAASVRRDRGMRGCDEGALCLAWWGFCTSIEDKHIAPHLPPHPYYLPPRQGVVPMHTCPPSLLPKMKHTHNVLHWFQPRPYISTPFDKHNHKL